MASRKQQIEAELQKYGIPLNNDHVQAIFEILKSDQRATVPSAARRYAQSQGNPQQPTGQTANNAAAPTGDKLQDTLSTLSNLLGDRLLEGVVSKAVERCNDRLLSGDWTINSDTQKKLQNLKSALDVEFVTVEDSFLSLPSRDMPSAKLLASSEEVLSAEVTAQ